MLRPLWAPYADLQQTISSSEIVPTTSQRPNNHAMHNMLHEGYRQPITQQSPEGGSSGYDSATYQVILRPEESPQSSENSSISEESYDVKQLSDDPEFQSYERRQLRLMAERNGGALFGENPKMRRTIRPGNGYSADDDYRRRRQKNNLAAKNSRNKRKMREIHLTLKVSYLKSEMARLKAALRQKRCQRCQRTNLAE